ncbi:hypothetical protein [Pseudomonas sp. NA-150]|uniref:hypothetical protein n=1 Tax=Pseudomonas sp. NA-150 TaxID=3367525 RepID=UPI0037C8FA0C
MSTHPVKLIVCIALGVWLGLVATAATGIFAYNTLVIGKVNAVSAAIGSMTSHKSRAENTDAESDTSSMFEKYKQNLMDTQAQQNHETAQAERDKRMSGPKCQFWMQQDQTAPSEKTRANVNQFCG